MQIAEKIITQFKAKGHETANQCNKGIIFSAADVAKFLLLVVAFLVIAHVIGSFFKRMPFEQTLFTKTFSQFFDLVGENNIPAAFSFLLLIMTSVLLFYISRITVRKVDIKYWLSLSVVFLFLSLDELLQIHERIDFHVKKNLFSTTFGLSAYVWIVPYFIGALIIGGLFLKFMLGLPNPTRNLFFVSGFAYVFAAIGIDAIQGAIQLYNINHVYYWLLTTIEEPVEMISIILFIYTLLNYITSNSKKLFIGTI